MLFPLQPLFIGHLTAWIESNHVVLVGMGKDEPRAVNKELAAAAGILDSVPDSVASGEGLEDVVAASPSLLLQCDEADSLLTAMRGTDFSPRPADSSTARRS